MTRQCRRKLLFPAGKFTGTRFRIRLSALISATQIFQGGWNRVVMNCGSEAFEVVALELGSSLCN